VPIRHWKSETTYHGIPWVFKRDPTHRFLIMVADHDMANDRGKRIRQLCEAADVGPERGMNVITSWRNAQGGGVQVMSAKQSKLGQDVDTLIFDDPVSEQDALTKEVRDSVDLAIAHYTARAGRAGRRGNVLGIMSRWHPDDPIGRRRSRQAITWQSIHAAAITVGEDGAERAFAPDVMTLEELHRRRDELREADPTERIWHAQFQNDPQPDVLGLFKNPTRYTTLPEGRGFRTIIGADLSYSSSRHADYFALVVLKIFPEMISEGGEMKMREVAYIVECRRERWDPAQSEAAIRQARAVYGNASVYSYMSGPEVGIARYLGDRGVAVNILPARYSKRQRAQPAIDLANAGRIRVPEGAPWASGFIARLMLFSGDEKAGDDDEIDALASAVGGGMAGMSYRPKTLAPRRI
jgi:predicted phage terminase large subunit-like protein